MLYFCFLITFLLIFCPSAPYSHTCTHTHKSGYPQDVVQHCCRYSAAEQQNNILFLTIGYIFSPHTQFRSWDIYAVKQPPNRTSLPPSLLHVCERYIIHDIYHITSKLIIRLPSGVYLCICHCRSTCIWIIVFLAIYVSGRFLDDVFWKFFSQ